MDLSAQAILVNRGDAEVVRLPAPDPKQNVIRREIQATLEANGDARVSIEYDTRGVDAASWRRRYEAEATRRERLLSDLGGEFPGFQLDKGAQGVRTSDFQDFDKPVVLAVSGRAPGFARREGGQLSLAVTTGVRLTPSFASLSRRKQDVRLLAFSTRDDTYRIKLPPGSQVVSEPPAVNKEDRFGAYSIAVERKPGEVVIKSRLELRATRIEPSQYSAWKRFCAEVDQAFSHRLIVTR